MTRVLSILAAALASAALAQTPPGPDTRVKITAEYARHVARDAYFWAWPIVNIDNRRLSFAPVKEAALSGPLMMAPLNEIAMLTDYVTADACRTAIPADVPLIPADRWRLEWHVLPASAHEALRLSGAAFDQPTPG